MPITKLFKGFEFVKIGEFYLSDCPFEYTHNGTKKLWKTPTAIKLIGNELLNSECSAYLVTLGSQCKEQDILYVGEYTTSLKERWFKEHKRGNTWVSWHSTNLDDNINLLLKKLNNIEHKDKQWVTTKSNYYGFEDKMAALISQAKAQEATPPVSLWLTTTPYFQALQSETCINASRSIEQVFLEDNTLALPFNSKGKLVTNNHTRSVKDILKTISNG